MKNLYSILFLCTISLSIYAQTPKATIVEHFTNTVCGICANNNPFLFSNLDNHPDVIHLSYHPSSPYPSCEFNQVDVAANDGRVQHYGQYGSTPKIMVNGTDLYTGSNFSNSQIYEDLAGQTSPFEISVEQLYGVNSPFVSEITIKTTESHSLENLKIYVAISEKTVSYDAPNGENTHYNVFRTAHTSSDGDDISISQVPEDSMSLTYSYMSDDGLFIGFDTYEFTTTVIIQDANTKEVYQAFQSNTGFDSSVSIEELNSPFINLYPNPSSDYISIDINEPFEINILDLNGRFIFSESLMPSESINIKSLSTGSYLLEISEGDKKVVTKFIKY